MTVEEMANYALKFSPSFKTKETPKVDDLIDMAQSQAQNGPVQGQVGWKGDFNSMAQKTVLRRLLSKYGFLSIEMMNALADDEPTTFDAEAIRNEENAEARPVINASQMMQDAEEVKAEEVKEEANPGTPEPDDKPNF